MMRILQLKSSHSLKQQRQKLKLHPLWAESALHISLTFTKFLIVRANSSWKWNMPIILFLHQITILYFIHPFIPKSLESLPEKRLAELDARYFVYQIRLHSHYSMDLYLQLPVLNLYSFASPHSFWTHTNTFIEYCSPVFFLFFFFAFPARFRFLPHSLHTHTQRSETRERINTQMCHRWCNKIFGQNFWFWFIFVNEGWRSAACLSWVSPHFSYFFIFLFLHSSFYLLLFIFHFLVYWTDVFLSMSSL